jgi:FkbM family methyltransferase
MKNYFNKYFKKIGFEIHGTGYLQKLRNTSVEKNAWQKQVHLVNNNAKRIFDIGANRGNTVSKYLNYFPNSEIHAFEPFKDSFEILFSKYFKEPNIHLNQLALTEKKGKIILNVNKSVDTNSILESTEIGASSDKYCKTLSSVEISTITLDDYCFQKGIDNIDIIKIDVQGAELSVLKGASHLLKHGRVQLLFIETYFLQQYINQPLFTEITDYLNSFGFIIQDLYDPYFVNDCLAWCDTIYIRKGY